MARIHLSAADLTHRARWPRRRALAATAAGLKDARARGTGACVGAGASLQTGVATGLVLPAFRAELACCLVVRAAIAIYLKGGARRLRVVETST